MSTPICPDCSSSGLCCTHLAEESIRANATARNSGTLLTALRRIEAECSFPSDEVQKTIRDVARKAIAQFEDRTFESSIPAVINSAVRHCQDCGKQLMSSDGDALRCFQCFPRDLETCAH
jgi:hypothetical protein